MNRKSMIRIQAVKFLDGFRVQLLLTNGKRKTVDLDQYLRGPIFDQIPKSPKLFLSLRVDKELGTIVWDNGADIDPDVLIEGRLPVWMNK